MIALARACMAALIWVFFIGTAGSLLVVVISFVQDLSQLMSKE